MYAPILITVYDRLDHLKATVFSLSRNTIATKSELFIAVDYPKNDDDRAGNQHLKIIEYVKSIRGFSKVNLIINSKNLGGRGNAANAVEVVFKSHDYLIRTEDDNVFSPYFLQYMNDALRKYHNDESVFAVCGYLEPINYEPKFNGCFSRKGFTSNGFALWKHKDIDINVALSGYLFNYLNPVAFSEMLNIMHYHVINGINYALTNNVLYYDLFLNFYLYKHNLTCIFPEKTLVRNIGQDGSGLNSGVNNEIQNQDIWNISGPVDVNVDHKVGDYLNEMVKRYHSKSFIYNLKVYLLYIKEHFGRANYDK